MHNNTAWQYMKPGSLVQSYGKVQYELTYAFDRIFAQASNDEAFGANYFQELQAWGSFRYQTRGGWETYDPDVGWDVGARVDKLATETWVSPIAIDMDGDGFDVLSLSESGAAFDYHGSKKSIRTAWLGGDDAFLVHDVNGDGHISDLSEMFGGLVIGEGFKKLRLHDSNGDNMISSKDDSWNSLQLWFDVNSNGLSEEGELRSLADAGVGNIELASSFTSIRNGDGYITETSSALVGGRISSVADIYFRVGGLIQDRELPTANCEGAGCGYDSSLTGNEMFVDPWIDSFALSHYIYSMSINNIAV